MTQQDFLKTVPLNTLLKSRFNPFILDKYYCRYCKKYSVEILNLKTQFYFWNKDGEVGKIDNYCFTSPKEMIEKIYIFDNSLLYEELRARPHRLRKHDKRKGGKFAIYKLTKHEIKLLKHDNTV
jgi:hypothetical protein